MQLGATQKLTSSKCIYLAVLQKKFLWDFETSIFVPSKLPKCQWLFLKMKVMVDVFHLVIVVTANKPFLSKDLIFNIF